ncbi:MAG: FlgD immunoglobulin-like domain containing protein, partial [Candidatus Cloacimonadaceae bacterium]
DSPIVNIEQRELVFGAIPVGEEACQTLFISNPSTSVLLGHAEVPEPFSLIDDSGQRHQGMNIVLSPKGFMELNVGFVPLSVGVFNENLTIITDATEPNIVINLSGEGTAVSNDDNVQQVITALKGNFPNPFNPTTNIAYSLKETAKVKIEIYNLKGQLVKTLVNDTLPKGEHRTTWNGQDQHGNSVSSGIYFYKMQVGDYTSTMKMMLMK